MENYKYVFLCSYHLYKSFPDQSLQVASRHKIGDNKPTEVSYKPLSLQRHIDPERAGLIDRSLPVRFIGDIISFDMIGHDLSSASNGQ